MSEWSTERIVDQYRSEIQRAFEDENARWRAEETADLARALSEHPDSAALVGWEIRDSFMWGIYASSTVVGDRNSVRIVLPNGFAIFPDLIEMFNRASVVWSKACVGAEIVDGEAHVVVRVLLVDYWDDERAAKWLAEQQPQKQRGTTDQERGADEPHRGA